MNEIEETSALARRIVAHDERLPVKVEGAWVSASTMLAIEQRDGRGGGRDE